ncbi:MAG: hypothetical protein FWE67_11020 [Planctomycetaceae bacterium]|nr:hypothetical protein [Planctomycetaceae bacterium]
MKHLYVIFMLTAVCFLLSLTGCGDKIKLGGKVTFPDGEPLGVGVIYFSKDDFLARAHLRPDGTYDVGSLGRKDGLPAGTDQHNSEFFILFGSDNKRRRHRR